MLMIADKQIRMIDGLYSLNDLHRASGGNKKHQEISIKQVSFINIDPKAVEQRKKWRVLK